MFQNLINPNLVNLAVIKRIREKVQVMADINTGQVQTVYTDKSHLLGTSTAKIEFCGLIHE
jgi:hypothetical protein